jgi:hypothetical protein
MLGSCEMTSLAHRPLPRAFFPLSLTKSVCRRRGVQTPRAVSENQSGEIIGAKNVSSELKIKSTPAALGNRERVSFQPAISGQTGVIICLRTPRHPARAGVDCESTDAPATPVTIVTAVQPLDSREYIW